MDYIVWKITESEEELRASLGHPEYYAEKVKNLKPGSRRMLEVLAVRRAVKELFYGEEQCIGYDAEGRPYLMADDGERVPYISISHTNGYVAVIADDHPVGIDIEQRGHRVQKVTSHYLRHEELSLIALTPDADLSLHLAWSAKEAAYKVLGRPYYDLQHLTTVTSIDFGKKQLVLAAEGRVEALIVHFDYTEDYVLAWVLLDSQR